MTDLIGAIALGLCGTAAAMTALIVWPGTWVAFSAITLHGAMWVALILWANLVWSRRD